ncbi:hypothetical protein FV219_10085 [Methylobacterium sp. WL122]|nr:hypothetical protein FV219_10085 [Methylobacterium sp. WL122]
MTDAASSNPQHQFVDVRKDVDGWTVYDSATDQPARINKVLQTGLDTEVADDFVDLLNTPARQKEECARH